MVEGQTARIKVSARCIVVRDGMLLVQVAKQGSTYRLPGGRVKPSESIVQTLERELREELGLELREARGPVYVVESFYRRRGRLVHEVSIYFLCVTEGEPEPRESHIDLRWLPLDQLSPDNFRPRRLVEVLRKDLARGSLPEAGYIVNVDL